MKQKNKILQEIISEEEKRKSKLEEIWNSLTEEDFEYIATLSIDNVLIM
jgi:hypothetical protein